MKPINLSLLNIKRLKAYRKSLLDNIVPYESCWCGSPGCDWEIEHGRKNPKYLFLCAERNRVNKELAARQMVEIVKKKKEHWADVPRVGWKPMDGWYFKV